MEAAQMEKTCCVTGHRDMDTEQMEEIRDALKKEVEKAVEDGYVSFLSSFPDRQNRFLQRPFWI